MRKPDQNKVHGREKIHTRFHEHNGRSSEIDAIYDHTNKDNRILVKFTNSAHNISIQLGNSAGGAEFSKVIPIFIFVSVAFKISNFICLVKYLGQTLFIQHETI